MERIDAVLRGIPGSVGVLSRDLLFIADWKRADARVKGETVHLDPRLVQEPIALVASAIMRTARDPAKSMTLGGRNPIFVPIARRVSPAGFRICAPLSKAPRSGGVHRLADLSTALHSTAHHIVGTANVQSASRTRGSAIHRGRIRARRHPKRRAREVLTLPFDRIDEVGRCDGGNATDRRNEPHDRPDGAVHWRTSALLEQTPRGRNL